MEKRGVNMYGAFVFILIVLDLKCFYLIDTSTFSLLGVSYLDLVFVLHALTIFFVLLQSLGRMRLNFTNLFMLFPVIMALLSAYAGTLTYNQPFFSGLVSQREWIGCLLMFFPVSYWVQTGKISVEQLIEIVKNICLIYLSVCILQYLLSDVLIFTYSQVKERYGTARFYFSSTYPVFISGFCLDNLLKGRNHRIRDFLIIVGSIIMCLIVTKGRMSTIAFLAALGVCCVFFKMGGYKKILTIILILAAAFVFLQTAIGQDILDAVFGSAAESDTLSVREEGRAYYLQLVFGQWYTALIGYGNPNLHWDIAQQITNPLWSAGGTARFYLVDNGLIADIFIYGLVGLAWYIAGLLYCLKGAYRIYKASGRIGYFLILISDLISFITLTPFAFEAFILLPIYITMIESELNGIKGSEDREASEEGICELCDGRSELSGLR